MGCYTKIIHCSKTHHQMECSFNSVDWTRVQPLALFKKLLGLIGTCWHTRRVRCVWVASWGPASMADSPRNSSYQPIVSQDKDTFIRRYKSLGCAWQIREVSNWRWSRHGQIQDIQKQSFQDIQLQRDAYRDSFLGVAFFTLWAVLGAPGKRNGPWQLWDKTSSDTKTYRATFNRRSPRRLCWWSSDLRWCPERTQRKNLKCVEC